MILRRQIIKICLCCIVLLCLCTGCGEDSRIDKPENNLPAEETFKTVQVSLKEQNIERLSIPESEILSQINVRILKLEDGVFYGFGHGPSGDGYRKKSFFKFDFDKNCFEVIDNNYFSYMVPQEYPEGSNVYYYFQTDENSPAKQLVKVDYNMFEEKMLLDFSTENMDEAVGFCIDGRSVYYINTRDDAVWQRSLADGKMTKLYDRAENAEELFVVGDAVYVRRPDSCIRIDTAKKTGEIIIKGLILGRQNDEIYYLNDSKTLCIYDLKTGKTKDNNMIAKSPSQDSHAAFSKPYHIDKWTGILSNPDNTIFIWDTLRETVAYKSKHKVIRNIFGTYADRYLIYVIDDSTLGVIDGKDHIDYVIDLAALIEQTGNPVEEWYMDGNYLYAQNICDWDIGDDLPDEFYRMKLID